MALKFIFIDSFDYYKSQVEQLMAKKGPKIPPKPPMLTGVTDDEWEFVFANFMKHKADAPLSAMEPPSPKLMNLLELVGANPYVNKQELLKVIAAPYGPQVFVSPGVAASIPPDFVPKVYHKSEKDDWGTPWPLFKLLSQAYGPFDLDPCADDWNKKCPMYFDVEDDGLKQQWFGNVFVNPPYSKVSEWVDKCAYEIAEGNAETITMLVAARTDTQWWFRLWGAAARIWFLIGRVQFEGAAHPAPFPSAVVQLGPKLKKNIALWDWKKSLKEMSCGSDSESGSSSL